MQERFFEISPVVTSADGVAPAMSFTLRKNTGGRQIQRCQGFAVDDNSFTPYALTLTPAGVSNGGVDMTRKIYLYPSLL
jgi:hypothetical protein